jgi:hypothetical protein
MVRLDRPDGSGPAAVTGDERPPGPLTLWVGKAGQVGRAGSQKTCPRATGLYMTISKTCGREKRYDSGAACAARSQRAQGMK